MALICKNDELEAYLAYVTKRSRCMKKAYSIIKDEKNRLERLVVDAMTGKEKELFLFSEELERITPWRFRKIIYADDGQGNEIRFHAFLPDRLRIAQEAAGDAFDSPLYMAFTSGLLHVYHRVARDAAEDGKEWHEYYDPKTCIEPGTIIGYMDAQFK